MDKDKIKKSKSADLEQHRSTFILMGIVLGLAIMFFAFEWSTPTTKMDETVVVQDVIAEEEIMITRREPTPPPPPPAPEPETPDVIEVVEEKVETVFRIDVEDDQSQRQTQIYVPPPPPVKQEEAIEEEIFQVVEERPEFPGGEAALMKFLNDNIKYPVIAQENGIQGRVIANFVVEKDGSITDVQVVRGVDPSIDREAVRVINSMPRWKPGKQRNQPVRVRFTLPIMFRLQN